MDTEKKDKKLPLEDWEKWNGRTSFGEKLKCVRTEQWEHSVYGYGLVGRTNGELGSEEAALYKKLVGVLFAEIRKLRKEIRELKRSKK